MFQQLYEPHSALKEFINNIMIHELTVGATETRHTFPIPPLPEHGLFFYVRDRGDAENISTKQKEKPSVPRRKVFLCAHFLQAAAPAIAIEIAVRHWQIPRLPLVNPQKLPKMLILRSQIIHTEVAACVSSL